jgi:hypothetical protein
MTGPGELQEKWLRKLSHGAAPVIDEPHAEVHFGAAFEASYLFSGTANNVAMSMMMIPATANPQTDYNEKVLAHLTIGMGGTAWGWGFLYEGLTVVTTGTAVLARNMDRAMPAANLLSENWLVFRNPTTTGVFTNLLSQWIVPGGAGAAANRSGGSRQTSLEWILDPAMQYLIVLMNQAGAQVVGDYELRLQWYESKIRDLRTTDMQLE